jgi:putative restriction endonuclease
LFIVGSFLVYAANLGKKNKKTKESYRFSYQKQYLCRCNKKNPSMTKDLEYYKTCFAHLNTAKKQGHMAPHKPLLLLSVIDLIEQGDITGNRIPLTDALIDAFRRNERRYVGLTPIFRPNIGNPYYHLQHEPFWQLVPKQAAPSSVPGNVPQPFTQVAEPVAPYNKKPSVNYTTKSLRTAYSYALIDPELFALLQHDNARVQLRLLLISTYLAPQSSDISHLDLLPICLTLVTLIA